MKRSMVVVLAALLGHAPATLAARPKRPPQTDSVKKTRRDTRPPPPPGDKGANEGSTGRKNATEDAARSAESPTNERRP